MGRGRKFLPSGKRTISRLLPRLFPVPKPNYFNVPKNEAEVVDLSPHANTPERQLKSLLLSTDDNTKVSAAVGMGGVGKSTGMRALGYDAQVWVRYRDGIWFIQLGQDATVGDLRAELSRFVDEVCSAEFGARFAKLLVQKGGDVAAVVALVKELEKLRMLFIFDDVWEENEVYAIVRRMATAVSESSGRLKMVISTRRQEVAHCPLTNKTVDFHPKQPQGMVARRILCVHAQVNPESIPDPLSSAGKAVENILERCGGLPVALAVAGSTVHIYMRDTEEGEDHDQSWVMLRDSLSVNAVRLGEKGSNEHKEGLFACLDASMHHVGNKWYTGKTETASVLLRCLCIFPKQTWIPLETLQRMWPIQAEEAVSFIEMLSDYSIVSHVGRKGKHGVRVHDLVVDYCGELARKDGTTLEMHQRLVEGYSRDLERVEGEEVVCMNWWSEKLSADGYIRTNVVRHLVGCGMIDEAVRLLCDFRWVQMLNGEKNRLPFQQCILDLKQIEGSISTTSEAGSEVRRGVGLLRETMELCVYACARNRVECSFQLHGRLSSLVSAPELFARCMWSIERYSTGLWAKAAPGVLRATGGSLKGSLHVPFIVNSIAVGVKGDEVVLGGFAGEVALMGLDDGVLRWEVNAHNRRVDALEINERTGDVFSTCNGEAIMVWREGTRIRQFHPLGVSTEEWVTCMKLLTPLKLIACGSNNGKLILMDMETGRIARTMNGHKDEITSLAAREDGELLISASRDHTVRRWDTKSGQPIGEPLRGHTDDVKCVALSADGHLIASGSDDGTLRLWDTKEGVEVCAAIRDHSDNVASVLFSLDNDVLFSGSLDEILVWDVSTPWSGVSMKRKLSHDMGLVTWLCLSPDGEELFAICNYRRQVYVWNAKAPQAVLGSRSSETSFVSDIVVFGISQNGEKMATCSKSSPNMIDIRRVYDVAGGADRVICSCPSTGFGTVGRVAVSNDMEHIAYILDLRNLTVYVARASTGKVVHELRGLSDWIHSLDETYFSHVSNIAFDSEDLTITGEALAFRRSDKKWVSKSMRWSVLAGQSCPVESCASATAIDADNSWQLSTQTDSAPHVWMEKDNINKYRFGREILASDGSKTFIAGTLDAPVHSVHYENMTRRLWISNYNKGLQFVDLINGPVADLPTVPPLIPLIPRPPPPQARDKVPAPRDPKSSTRYTVFISYSGPDKPLADWLYKALTALGISVFAAKSEIKMGDVASDVMIDAMKHAYITIIIVSKEYPAKKWTMKELLCFQRRRQNAKEKGEVGPIIIPLFFRMSVRECKNPSILETKTEDGKEYVFHKYRFFDRLDDISVADMKMALQKLGGIQGVENHTGISYKPKPGQSEEEWQKELHGLLEEVVEAVVEVVPTPGKRIVCAPRAVGPFYPGVGGSVSPSSGPNGTT